MDSYLRHLLSVVNEPTFPRHFFCMPWIRIYGMHCLPLKTFERHASGRQKGTTFHGMLIHGIFLHAVDAHLRHAMHAVKSQFCCSARTRVLA